MTVPPFSDIASGVEQNLGKVSNQIGDIGARVQNGLGDIITGLGLAGSGAPTTINSLIANIAKNQLVNPTKYEITFKRMSPLENLRLAVSCESVSLPGRNIATSDITIQGPVWNMPYALTYAEDLDVTFKLSKDFFERKVFEDWQTNFIISDKTYRLKYLEQYATEIEVTQYDYQDFPIYKIVLEDAWPKTISAIELGDDRADEYSRQSVAFAYRKWRSEVPAAPSILQRIVKRLDLVGRLNRKLVPFGGANMPVPFIPTAVAGQVVNLPFGMDPNQITEQGAEIISNELGDIL